MEYIELNTITALHDHYQYGKPTHPLISVIDLTKITRPAPKEQEYYRMGVYTISCKQFTGELKYGRSTYDFSEGTLAFTAPGQIISPSPNAKVTEGWALYIHPDFLQASSKALQMAGMSFFSYDINEALHVSDAEKQILRECVSNIEREITQNIDKHTYNLILSNLDLLLTYSERFYDRQFLTRMKVSNDLLERFERLLDDVFLKNALAELPDVKYFASALHLSPNYLGDLLSKYTGKSTQEHIHLKLIEKAKTLLKGTPKSVSEVAYDLGFEYPSYFTKLFKAKTGLSPREFRSLN